MEYVVSTYCALLFPWWQSWLKKGLMSWNTLIACQVSCDNCNNSGDVELGQEVFWKNTGLSNLPAVVHNCTAIDGPSTCPLACGKVWHTFAFFTFAMIICVEAGGTRTLLSKIPLIIITAVLQSACISAQVFGMKKGSESSKLSEIAFVGQYTGTVEMETPIFFLVPPCFWSHWQLLGKDIDLTEEECCPSACKCKFSSQAATPNYAITFCQVVIFDW